MSRDTGYGESKRALAAKYQLCLFVSGRSATAIAIVSIDARVPIRYRSRRSIDRIRFDPT